MNERPQNNLLKIWHIPQVPMRSFEVYVSSPDEAALYIDMLAQYDTYEFNRKVKPDYSNASGLQVFEDGEWLDWYTEDGDDFDTWMLDNWKKPKVLDDFTLTKCLNLLTEYDDFQLKNNVKGSRSSKHSFLNIWPENTIRFYE